MKSANLERYLIEFTLSKVRISSLGVILLTIIASCHSILVYKASEWALVFASLTVFINLARVSKCRNYSINKIVLFSIDQIKRELKVQALLAWFSAFSVSLWTSFLMHNFGTTHPTFFVSLIMISGMASAGMVTFSAHVATYKTYVLLLFLSWLAQGLIFYLDEHFFIIALTSVLFILFLFKTSKIMHDAFLDQAHMSFNADKATQIIQSYLRSLPGVVSVFDQHLNYVFESHNFDKPTNLGDTYRLGYKYPDSVFVKNVKEFAKSKNEKFEFIEKINFNQSEARTRQFYLSKIEEHQKILCFSMDIEDQVQIENNLLKERLNLENASRLASLGEMAAGIAHEINNPLAIISGSLAVIPRFLDNREKLLSKLANIETATDRISKIVYSMRVFSRKSDSVDSPPNSIDSIIENILPMAIEKIKRNNIDLSLKLNSKSVSSLQEVAIGQILINLINNAVDAIGGKDQAWIKIETQELGTDLDRPYIEVRVTDSGPGIPPELRSKILEPFFTTKPVGKGTGLGLSVAVKSAEHFGGKLEIDESHPNTSFVLKIPLRIYKN